MHTSSSFEEINNNKKEEGQEYDSFFIKSQSQPLNLKVCQFEDNTYDNNQYIGTSSSVIISNSIGVGTGINNSRELTENDDNNHCNVESSLSNKWAVRTANTWHQDLIEDYKMSSRQRGICLIINNVSFELDSLPARIGSDMDAHRFKKIFTQLGFEVESKRNVTSDKMKVTFKQISARCSIKHDALVVILLSHGTESGIYAVDGLEVDLNDILTNFDNKRCKQMIGKPKFFIVQSCRGRLFDYGVKETQTLLSQSGTQGSTQASVFNSSERLKITRWTEFDNNNHPTRTDMLLCFSCQTGYVSTRNENEGSWLGASLAKYLVRESCRKNLIQILNMVSRDVRKRKSSDGHKQVLEITSIGFDKNLYFNPGLFIDN